jgi:hypothetical protein
MTDTLGRIITFHYDSSNRLTSIKAPGYNGGSPRELIRLHYSQKTIGSGLFSLTQMVRNSTVWMIDAIYYPATSTGYWFGDNDSYSAYGMIAKAIE